MSDRMALFHKRKLVLADIRYHTKDRIQARIKLQKKRGKK